MSEYIIATDSCADIPMYLVEKINIKVMPLSVIIDENEYKNYPDEREIKMSKIYDELRNEKVITTSAVNIDYFLNEFEKILIDGKDIIYLGFSSKLSSTYNNAKIAMDELREKYKDRKLICIDTVCGASGQCLLVYLAHHEKENGKTIEELAEFIDKIKLNICHLFTVDDLLYLKRSGRISSSTATLGTVFNIKPILHMDKDGYLKSISKSRGRQKALDDLFDRLKKTAIKIENQTVFISHCDCKSDAYYLSTRIKKELGVKEVIINIAGPVVCAHTGIGTVAAFFIGKKR